MQGIWRNQDQLVPRILSVSVSIVEEIGPLAPWSNRNAVGNPQQTFMEQTFEESREELGLFHREAMAGLRASSAFGKVR